MDFFIWFFNLSIFDAVLFLLKVIILCFAVIIPAFIISGSVVLVYGIVNRTKKMNPSKVNQNKFVEFYEPK